MPASAAGAEHRVIEGPRLPFPTGDILCGEIGAPDGERWSAPVTISRQDQPAVEALERDRVLETRAGDAGLQIAGTDQVGLIVLPSGRRICVRPKIGGVTLLDWMAYLGESPPPPKHWLRDAPGAGGPFHSMLAGLFVEELERLTRGHLRKGYVAARTESGTIRGRVLAGALARNYHRLPAVPQAQRVLSLDTPHNGLLAAALDRVPALLDAPDAATRGRLTASAATWAGVRRPPPDVACSVVGELLLTCPPGYASAMQLASAILKGYTPHGHAGTGGATFLVSVAALWERGVRRMCADLRAAGTGWSPVPDSERTKRWHDGPGLDIQDPVRWMTADAIVASGSRRWVLDAKYKSARGGYGDEGRSDRFQLCAYAMAFDAERGSLVYPSAEGGVARIRLLLSGRVRDKPVTIDSINLPMAAGPDVCRRALTDLARAVVGAGSQPARAQPAEPHAHNL